MSFQCSYLDNGYYLPEDKYLLVNEQELDYIAQLNPDVINDAYQNLKPEREEEYNELETQNGKINFLLQTYLKEFRKGGISRKRFILLHLKFLAMLMNLSLMLL